MLFTVTVGMPFWVLGEHEHMIVALFLPIKKLMYWREPWTVRVSELKEVKVISLEREYKSEWERLIPLLMGGELRQVSE